MAEPIDVHKIFAEYFKGCEALAYALSSKLAEGNICLDINDYKRELPDLLEQQKGKVTFPEKDAIFWVSPEDFEKQCEAGEFVTHSPLELKPFIILKDKAYLQRYYTYENQIIENIRRLGKNFHIITGGPGTGKTYSVSTKLLEMFGKNIYLKVALAAPTGKAAERMNESIRKFAEDPGKTIDKEIKNKLTGLKAQTIHRLLVYVPDSVFFKYDEKNRLPYDAVIIDECSMIDGPMMAKLLNATEDSTKVYLLGDKDQLASVEAGSVFGDTCRAADSKILKDRIEFKTESHRFDYNRGIGKLSREVISGTFSEIDAYNNDEQITFDTSFSPALFNEYAILYENYIVQPDIKKALQLLNMVRFLCVTRESVTEANKKIQYFLSQNVKDFKPKSYGFYENQPVIITKNDYNLGLFNGDVGLIRKEGETLYAWFETNEGEIKKIQAGFLNYYDTVFAMTIHKSQGSEFDNVVLILPEKQGEKLLTRELLYTGVTRAREKVLLQTSENALKKCIERSVSRASGLENRLNAE